MRRSLMRSTASMCSVPPTHSVPNAVASERPNGVSEYSTFGGISW